MSMLNDASPPLPIGGLSAPADGLDVVVLEKSVRNATSYFFIPRFHNANNVCKIGMRALFNTAKLTYFETLVFD